MITQDMVEKFKEIPLADLIRELKDIVDTLKPDIDHIKLQMINGLFDFIASTMDGISLGDLVGLETSGGVVFAQMKADFDPARFMATASEVANDEQQILSEGVNELVSDAYQLMSSEKEAAADGDVTAGIRNAKEFGNDA